MKKRPFWLSLIAMLTIIGSVLTILGSIPVFSLYNSFSQGGVTVGNKVSVKDIQPGSPAQGVLQKEDVIVSINGNAILNPNSMVVAGTENKGRQINIVVQRNGQNKTLSLTPRTNPEPGQGAIGALLSTNAVEKKPAYEFIPETLIKGYAGQEIEQGFPFSATRIYQDKSYSRLMSLMFGLISIVIGVGLWKLKRWSWYAFIALTLLGILLSVPFIITSFTRNTNPTSIVINPLVSKKDPSLDLLIYVLSTMIEIIVAIYIYKLKPLFIKK